MKSMARGLIKWWIVGISGLSLGWPAYPSSLHRLAPPHPSPLSTCPSDVETLTTQMLRDLPSYANRTSQRARHLNRTTDISSYMLLAGRPEFAPLKLGPGEYTSDAKFIAQEPQQVFFTTLERQYTFGKEVDLQQYHWLFLTQTVSGWRLAMMFSQIGPYPAGRPPTPSRDSSNGVIAQAINTWLDDCRAGAVRTQ